MSMKSYVSLFKNSRFQSALMGAVLAVLFTTVSVYGATTISTNISTEGTLSVTGASTLTGLTTMGYASSTGQSLTRNITVGGMSTTTGSSGNVELRGGLTVGDATANSLAGTILLAGYTTALEPTGVTQGTIYYNSTNKTLKMFDGSNWFTVGTTTGGLSLNTNNIRLDDVTRRNMTLGTTTQPSAGKALVTLEATTTASIPLSIVGYSGQTGHLLDVFNGSSISSPKLLYISSSGGLFASSTGAFGGTLTVGGAVTATSTLNVTGLTTLGFASTTAISLNGADSNFMVNGYATTTALNGNIATAGTLTVVGTSNFTGVATITYASSTSFSTSVASTTNLTLGAGSTLAGMIFGTCDVSQTQITASTTRGVPCTGATGITTAYKVFVSATSTLATTTLTNHIFAVTAASSTGSATIGIEIANLSGMTLTPAGTLNFWAVR